MKFSSAYSTRMTCERTLIHARSTSWAAPQNLQFTLWTPVMGWVPILGSTARNSDWWFFIDTILRLLYTNPTSKSQTNDSYDYEKFIIVIILNNVSVCRSKTWYKVEDMISKFSASSAGDSILMNNSMHGAFDLTDIFCIPTCEKINRKSIGLFHEWKLNKAEVREKTGKFAVIQNCWFTGLFLFVEV